MSGENDLLPSDLRVPDYANIHIWLHTGKRIEIPWLGKIPKGRTRDAQEIFAVLIALANGVMHPLCQYRMSPFAIRQRSGRS